MLAINDIQTTMKSPLFFLNALAVTSLALAAPAPTPAMTNLPVVNDGFLIVSQAFYKGPVLMVCEPGLQRQTSEVAKPNLSAARVVCKSPSTSWRDKNIIEREPVTTQQALDAKFGRGVVTFVGVVPYSYSGDLVVYYRINPQRP